jgi:tetratricopeptide (TPR) repeat protein
MLSKAADDRPRNASAVVRGLGNVIAGAGVTPSIVPPPRLSHDERRAAALVLVRGAALAETAYAERAAGGAPSVSVADIETSIRPLGGEVYALAEGSLAVTFTSAPASEVAERAARTALELSARFPAAPLSLTVGSTDVARPTAERDLLDRATRLARAAQGGEIVVDDVAAALLDSRFQVAGGLRGPTLRGTRPHPARTLLGRPTPFVGRDRELSQLVELLDRCVDERVPRAVLVIGRTGMGKSRLRQELLSRVHASQRAEAWLARADPMRDARPFGLIAGLLRAAAGVAEADDAELLRGRLRARVGALHGETDAPRISDFLAELCSATAGEPLGAEVRAARLNPTLMGEQMTRAWLDFVTAECRASPRLLVLEDLHWGDLPSVRLIDAALGTPDCQLMALALARPDARTRFPRLWKNRLVTEVQLAPLAPQAASKLVRAVLGDATAPGVERRIVERAAGDVLFLEELIRASARGQRGAEPETVLLLLKSRIEALPADSRRVLRAASIFGDTFLRGGVEALLGPDVDRSDLDQVLASLSREEVISLRSAGASPAEAGYVFRHAVVREAAYATLVDADRGLGHALAADWLEGRGEADALVLADHCQRAGMNAAAAAHYRRAAEQALRGQDAVEALARIARGRALTDAGAELGLLLVVEADAHAWRGDSALAADSARAAMRAAPARSTTWWAAAERLARMAGGVMGELVEMADAMLVDVEGPPTSSAEVDALAATARSLLYRGHTARADHLFQRLALCGDAQDPVSSARRHRALAVRALFGGDPGGYLRLTRVALAASDATGDAYGACFDRIHAGFAEMELGRYQEAEALLSDALRRADRMGLRRLRALAAHNQGLALARLGDPEGGRRLEEEAMATFGSLGERRLEAGCSVYLALILSDQRLGAAARRAAHTAVEQSRGVPPLEAYALAVAANLHAQGGDAPTALELSQRAVDIADRLGGLESGEGLVRLVHAEALHAEGRIDDAHRAMDRAVTRLRQRAALIEPAALRTSFLEKVPEHARTLAVAARWGVAAAT